MREEFEPLACSAKIAIMSNLKTAKTEKGFSEAKLRV